MASVRDVVPFEFVMYYGYSERALKGYNGETMPSLGITNRFFCPVHKRVEFMAFVDLDYHYDGCDGEDADLVLRTKYGCHLVYVLHTRFRLKAFVKTFVEMMKRRRYADWGYLKVSLRRGFEILRVYGKYADDPYVTVVKYNSGDKVAKLLAEGVYSTVRRAK